MIRRPTRWLAAAALLFLAGCAAPAERLTLQPLTFEELDGWNSDRHQEALAAFKRNCEAILKRSPDATMGSGRLAAPASLWQGPCRAAQDVPDSDEAARRFFEQHFLPFRAGNNGKEEGLFTGYYEPYLNGSRRKTSRYRHPLYRLPADIQDGVPYYTRAEIESGALAGKGLELLWVDDAADLFFLQVQGSGRVKLENGHVVRVGYAGKNNQPYTSLGKVMGERGVLPKDGIDAFTIRRWLRANHGPARELMQQNASYVFFRELGEEGAIGGSGAALTPLRSLAVDTRHVPYPMPIYLECSLPQTEYAQACPLNRLMIAQDTGGAIKGPVRGDVFFGAGKQAEAWASLMKQRGRYALLLPRALASRL